MERIGRLDEQVPKRRDENRQKQHDEPHDPQIRPDEWREVVVVDLLGKAQDRDGKIMTAGVLSMSRSTSPSMTQAVAVSGRSV